MGFVVHAAQTHRVAKNPERDDREGEDIIAGLDMPAEGLVLVRQGHVSVHTSVDYISVDTHDVCRRRGIFHEDVLGWEGPIADGVDVVIPYRSDAGKEYGIANLLLFNHVLDARQQVGLVLEAQTDDDFELAGHRIGVGNFVAIPLGIILGGCWLGHFDSTPLSRKRSGHCSKNHYRYQTFHWVAP